MSYDVGKIEIVRIIKIWFVRLSYQLFRNDQGGVTL